MNKRPTSVTVIAWILLVTSAMSLASITIALRNPIAHEIMAKSPVPIPLQYLMLFVRLLVSFVCATFMLKGANWARLLYIAWGAFGLLIGVFTSSGARLMLIPGFILYVVFAFFLLRPKASDYFSRSADEQGN